MNEEAVLHLRECSCYLWEMKAQSPAGGRDLFMQSAWEANAARAAAIWKAIMYQGCSLGEFMNDTLRITELLFKGRLCLQILCPLSSHGSRVFNPIVLPGIIPWIVGHSVSGTFALQVRKMHGCWFSAAGRI